MKHNIKQGEMLSTTTVRVVMTKPKGVSSGTGFFYSIGEDEHYIPCLITNRHVAKDAIDMQIAISASTADGDRLNKPFTFVIRDIQAGILYHPDIDVDLCAVTLFPIIEDLRREGIELHTYFFNNKVIPDKKQLQELDALEEVIMVGYPKGLWDEVNNMPLFRRGITATSPKVDFNNKKEFLVDMACINGSSGSPVMYLNRRYRTDVGYGISGHEMYLLGVLYAGPSYKVNLEVEGKEVQGAVIAIPINIGYVIKSERILELEKVILAKVESERTQANK